MDCGIKNSQIRIILNKVKEHNALNPNNTFTVIITPLVPYKNYIFIDCCVGLFISNGPGDPRDECLEPLVELIKNMWQVESNIFGICLGHQLISLATGHEIKKMKYGNRGHNIPVCLRDTDTKNLGFVTSQNHGYMTIEEEKDLNDPQNNYSYFKNINDNSNEGLVGDNIFSVQFHPEARAGPDDTTFLFDIFLKRCLILHQRNTKILHHIKT